MKTKCGRNGDMDKLKTSLEETMTLEMVGWGMKINVHIDLSKINVTDENLVTRLFDDLTMWVWMDTGELRQWKHFQDPNLTKLIDCDVNWWNIFYV